MRSLAVLVLVPALAGCAAASAFDLATAPVRAGAKAIQTTGQVYDRVTVSDSERDQKRGRQIRQREERLGKLERSYRRAREDCREGDDDACRDAARLRYDMDELMPSVPYEPE